MNEYDLEFEKIINNSKSYFIRMQPRFDYKLLETFVKKYKHLFYWDEISIYQHLSEEFITEFSDYVDWTNISYSQNLSEEFIKKFHTKINWYYICSKKKLSKDFIKEFADKIDCHYISLCYFKLQHERSWKTFI